MIDAARLPRECSVDTIADLLRQLGYPAELVPLNAEEWRCVDIAVPAGCTLHLACRIDHVDLFVLIAPHDDVRAGVRAFLESLAAHNAICKSIVLLNVAGTSSLSIYDLNGAGALRRFDLDLERPSSQAIDRLNLLAREEHDGLGVERLFDRALDRETLTRRFFERFRTAVQAVAEELARRCSVEPSEANAAQALLLLSRLLFIYFIQEKGWLNHERRFLAERLTSSIRRGEDFFATVVQPLFFGCLNTPVPSREPEARALGDIPYLNGGLFEPSPYECRNPNLTLPNDLLSLIVEDVFERFAFSIDEGDVAGLHVDPEMLGKVFESLMAADERAASGSFYTPKSIVDILTERAVVAWCTDGDRALGALLRGDSMALDRDVAAGLLGRLGQITILDPACGSGAFLLSALAIIERLTQRLSNAAGVGIERGLRQRIVERSLFGVDLKSEAVRLCELRLWLAIVSADDTSIDDVPPLPNLDRNILQGHSLLSPTDFLGDQRLDVYRDWIYALQQQADLVARYRTTTQSQRPALQRMIRANDRRLAGELLTSSIAKDERELDLLLHPASDLFGEEHVVSRGKASELRERIAESRLMLERSERGDLEFFSFDVHFATTVAGGGFSVVLGNPPWVRNSRIDPRSRRLYADRYRFFRGGGNGFSQADLSVAFVERAVALAAPGGVVSMLLPAKILNAGYAAVLREALTQLAIVDLDDWSETAHGVFDADTFPLGLTVRKSAEPSASVAVSANGTHFHMPQRQLSVRDRRSEWSLVMPECDAVLRRLRSTFSPLAETLGRRPLMGVKTGDNHSFFVDIEHIAGGIAETSDGIRIPTAFLCRCVRGRDVRRWSVGESIWMLWPPRGGWRTPPEWLEELAANRGVEATELELAFVRPEHVGIKVAWKDVSRGLCATVLPDTVHAGGEEIPLVPNQTLYSLDAATLEEAYVLAALLNSTIAGALAVCTAERAKDFHFRYFGRTIAGIPLPKVDRKSDGWRTLARLSRRAHCGDPIGERIDEVVRELYGVTPAEGQRLAGFVRMRLGQDVDE
jgi:hypothetical protein